MPGSNLTRVEAIQRATLIATQQYDVQLDLTRGAETFRAETTVTFSSTPGSNTFIDLLATRVHRVSLNGRELDPDEVFADCRITLPDLAAENTLTIISDQRYTNTGEGLHRFVDPADGEVYLYSQLEVPDCRRVFPVFEQPDLKATFRFTVIAPARWQVVSNQPTPEATPLGVTHNPLGIDANSPANAGTDEAIACWRFEATPVMSSYITALIAGPYHAVRDQLTSADGRMIPLGIFCRSSLSEHLDADYIFEKTKQGFQFFEREFNYPYPFDKYDQLFVPEYNMGAMENIGAVTFTEAYVFRGRVADATRERRVVTILHELAHMWFGDLVTMRWWNDLWLNESFAEYMSTLGVAEATEWHECWATFAASEKTWAYRQDQLPTTHPVVAEIRDIEDVLVNFDGITYAKGASVLKQLVAWVGREPFMRGVHDYFVAHHHSNTELKDLLTELESRSGRDLAQWSAKWLETSGVNTLRPEFSLNAAGEFTRFSVQQTGGTLRPHRIAIGLYRNEGNAIRRYSRVEVDIDGADTPVPELLGSARPDLLLLNDDDLSYTKIRLDPHSLASAAEHLGSVDSSLTRALLWGTIWDQTRDGEFAASRFITVALAHLGQETQSTVLRTVLQQLLQATSHYIAPERRDATILQVADALWRLAETAQPGSDAQFQFVLAFTSLARSETQLNRVQTLFAQHTQQQATPNVPSQSPLTGLVVDTELSWELLVSLAAGGRATAADIEAALERDQTANGAQHATRARAALPTADAKRRAWAAVFEGSELPNAMVRESGRGFLRAHDRSLLHPYLDQFFDSLLEVWHSRSHAIVEEIVDGFYPAPLANQQLQTATARWLDQHPDAAPALRRMIRERLADVERALTAQAVDRKDMASSSPSL